MKKPMNQWGSGRPLWKFDLKMKITTLLLITTLFGLHANDSYAQMTKVTLDVENATVGNIIDDIESATEFRFIYKTKHVDLQRKVSLKVENVQIEKVLASLFGNTKTIYKVRGKHIILRQSKEENAIVKETPKVTFINQSQDQTITGTITDSDGTPLPGANILEKGTTNGVQSDFDGNFSIEVSDENAILVVSYIGFANKEISVNGQTTINVQLEESTEGLDEVVVTALGISRDARSLTYATQNVDGEAITKAKDPNFLNTLAGKVAGAVITKGNFGPGSSPRILMRGNKSLTGNSDPLFVLNGVPMYGGTDLLANLNPEDIESLQILKGASAAALYGSEAANGVVLVSTKMGTEGDARIEFSSQTTMDNAVGLPQLQTNYGQADPALNDSWGPEISNGSDDHLKEFFQLGQNSINSLTFSNGNEQAQVYLSYANTNAKGILPENRLVQNNYTARLTSQLLDDKLSLDASINYTNKKVYNQNNPGGYSALPGIYSFPVGDDFSQYDQDNFEVFDPARQLYVQNWPYIRNETFPNQNPYWVQNRNQTDFLRDQLISSITASYEFLDGLKLQGRLTSDRINDENEFRNYASTQSTVAGPNGGYGTGKRSVKNLYTDMLLILDKNLNDNLSLSGTLGVSEKRVTLSEINLSSTRETSLSYPNFFSVFALNGLFNKSEGLRKSSTTSAFGNATLGFKESLFLDVTARNEWTSTVSEDFFYPSVGVTYILPTIEGKGLTFAKLRASYAEVGKALPFGVASLSPPYSLNNSGNIQPRNALPFFEGADTLNLKPERTKSYELGLDARFFEGKLKLSLTYYNATSEDQLLQIAAPVGAGAENFWINGGRIRNKGVEGTLGYSTTSDNFQWNSSINFSTNKNEVLELSDRLDTDRFVIATFNQSRVVASYLTRPKDGEYGSFGDLYGRVYQRDENGNLLTNEEGIPLISEDTENFIGNANPDFLIGFNNTFTYKNASLSFLIDGRFGGGVINRTEIWLDYKGLSRRTGLARDNGGVSVNGQLVDAQQFYLNQTGAGASAVATEYFFDATNVRLRELSLGYDFPRFAAVDINVSLIGRNLFFFYKKAPFDPEIAASTSTATEGIASFTMPSTSSFGLSLLARF